MMFCYLGEKVSKRLDKKTQKLEKIERNQFLWYSMTWNDTAMIHEGARQKWMHASEGVRRKRFMVLEEMDG